MRQERQRLYYYQDKTKGDYLVVDKSQVDTSSGTKTSVKYKGAAAVKPGEVGTVSEVWISEDFLSRNCNRVYRKDIDKSWLEVLIV